jgi:hypothetical protein
MKKILSIQKQGTISLNRIRWTNVDKIGTNT